MIFQNKIIFTMFLFSSVIPISLKTAQPITVNLYNNNSNDSSPVLQAHQTSSQEILLTHNFKIHLPHFKMPAAFHNLPNPSTALSDYKWYIAGSTACTVYLYFNFKIYTINKLLEDPSSWSLWKEEIPLNRLTTIDKTELFKQLKIDICKKYFNAIDATKDSEVLAKLLQSINHEKQLLEFYQSIHKTFSALYLSRLFVSTKTLEQIAQYIARLNFLINLYLEVSIQLNDVTKKTI